MLTILGDQALHVGYLDLRELSLGHLLQISLYALPWCSKFGGMDASLITRQLGFDEFGPVCVIHAMHGKDIFGEIDPNGDNGHGFPLL